MKNRSPGAQERLSVQWLPFPLPLRVCRSNGSAYRSWPGEVVVTRAASIARCSTRVPRCVTQCVGIRSFRDYMGFTTGSQVRVNWSPSSRVPCRGPPRAGKNRTIRRRFEEISATCDAPRVCITIGLFLLRTRIASPRVQVYRGRGD